ncbi:Type 1 glutamine amidotransferase-like domain-containing protein [Clostridium sp. CS001]|uniref:Type 1 glutamine amidotransferase-like domain-containing protein n=1 Tax=Clostridium sp. CS001 TaxID=2880648 RepID=UPI001CF4B24F|nr:Type 1 glutamine amidotransferase-like domain-containing protein [Clostridium sp. CS001]MCB2291549.1 Type 1 glutamine amidotransferase-like domain-containing protein [Clostridium sp. CS001]
MYKLLLTSAGFENPKVGNEFLKLINNNPSIVKVLFIPTASRTEDELYYVEESRKELLDVGIKEENIIIYNLDYTISNDVLDKISVVYVCGGNTFYLLNKIREVKFDSVLNKLMQSGVIYVGASAGSLVVGPNINIPDYSDSNDICISDFNGLNITDIVVVPHYSDRQKEIIDEAKKNTKYPIVPLTDSQALLIMHGNITIIE